MSRLTARLRAMTPHCQQDALIKIKSIISQALPPLVSFKPHEPESNSKPEFFDPPKEARLVHNEEANTDLVSYMQHLQVIKPEIGIPFIRIDKLLAEFDHSYEAPAEISTSMFDFEDLILSHPTENPTVLVDTTTTAQSSKDPTPTPTNTDNPPPPPLSISTTSHNTHSAVESQHVTCKRPREAGILQKPDLINPNLPALLAKYHIYTWLQHYVIDIREVKGDGHRGFRAIAISIGQSQEYWAGIRSRMQDTVTAIPDDRSLPEARTDCLARLATDKPNVVSEQKYWLSMPGWGGLIATTFNRPVLYYKPGSHSQLVFPFFTPHNLNPPIVLAWADHHFASLLLDCTRPNFPAPHLCGTWRRFHTEEASSWLDAWQPFINSHAKFLQTQNQTLRKKNKIKDPITLTLFD